MLGNPADADEAAQEAFVKAFRAINAFESRSGFSTWLHRIAANECLDVLRRRAREKLDSWDALTELEGSRLERLLAEPDAAGASETSDLIDRILSQLPPDYRLILALRELRGFSYEEIAEVLECSLDSVKARLRRARQELQKKLRHFSGSKDV